MLESGDDISVHMYASVCVRVCVLPVHSLVYSAAIASVML